MERTDFDILIVEDEFIAQNYLRSILNKMGFLNICVATSSDETLGILSQYNINLIFMDINILGSVDGISCAKMVNEKKSIPIIYTTAYADADTISDIQETNAFGYIIKPFTYEEVYSTMVIALQFMKKNNIIKKTSDVIIVTKNYKYYKKSKTLKKDGILITLTKKERELFEQLLLRKNQNVSYSILIDNVWNGIEVSSSTIRDAVSKLKKKLPELDIQNVPKYGYILNLDN